MDCGGIDTTPPEYPSASTCSSMIRPLLELPGCRDIAPVGPIPLPGNEHGHRAAILRRAAGRRVELGEFHRDPLDAAGQVVDVGVASGNDPADEHDE